MNGSLQVLLGAVAMLVLVLLMAFFYLVLTTPSLPCPDHYVISHYLGTDFCVKGGSNQ